NSSLYGCCHSRRSSERCLWFPLASVGKGEENHVAGVGAATRAAGRFVFLYQGRAQSYPPQQSAVFCADYRHLRVETATGFQANGSCFELPAADPIMEVNYQQPQQPTLAADSPELMTVKVR